MACVQYESKSPGRKTKRWKLLEQRLSRLWSLGQQQHPHHLGTCSKCTFPGPTPNLLTGKPNPYFQSPSGDAGAGSSLGPGGLKHAQCCWSSLFPLCSAELHLVPTSKPSLLPSATGSPVSSQSNYSFCSLPPPHCLFHSLAFPLFYIN